MIGRLIFNSVCIRAWKYLNFDRLNNKHSLFLIWWQLASLLPLYEIITDYDGERIASLTLIYTLLMIQAYYT
jgi:hypothetical protein